MIRNRKLAAIMFTDIKGYTALMQQDEEKAIQVREKHRRIFNAVTEKHQGKILQYYGDGTLSIFDSAIEAVNCGIELQQGFQEAPAVPVRIGIHTGDIVFSDEEIIGDGVNVASRIESLGVPGGVLISDKVYDEIKNQPSIRTSRVKSFKFKNVAKPIEIYAVSNDGLIVPKPEEMQGKTDPEKAPGRRSFLSMVLAGLVMVAAFWLGYWQFSGKADAAVAPSLTDEPSIAVLAFENMSTDPEQEYFSDGISEEILNALANMEGLKVAGRTSAFSFKGKNEDIRSIGNKLGVNMVLEGSVRKFDDQVRITAQLINVADGYHLWSETYDRELKDVLAVQLEIAGHIAEKLKLQVSQPVNREVGTSNPEAYESLLRGVYFFEKGYSFKTKAMEAFQRAVELDPDYALAHAYIGETFLHYAGMETLTTPEAYTQVRIAAEKALSLDDREPKAYKILAYVYLFYDWNWKKAIEYYEKALAYGLPEENEFITYYEIFVNKDYDRAVAVAERKLETEPLDPEKHWQLGMCHYFAGQFREALAAYNGALELDPSYHDAQHWKGAVLAYLGRFEEAETAYAQAGELTQQAGLADLLMLQVLKGEKEAVLEQLKTAEFGDPVSPAILYARMEMPEEAVQWLEKGYRERSLMMITLKYSWIWDPIRKDPGFQEIYERMNF